MKISLNTKTAAIAAIIALAVTGFAACGSSGTADTTSTDRLITGTITSDANASLSKSDMVASDSTSDCIDTECAVIATNSDGEEVSGEIDNATHRWQVRLAAGEWKIGFFDSEGNLVGYLDVGDVTTFNIEAGEDIDLGEMLLRNGFGTLINDIEGLGELGFRSGFKNDTDFDGEFEGMDDAEPIYDPLVFSVIKVAPFSGKENVAPCRPVKIHLSQAIDETTLNAASVAVTDAEGTAIEGSFEYEVEYATEDGEQNEYEIKFSPAGGYALGSVITVLIPSSAEGLLNSDGLPLDQEYSWSFTVRDFGGSSMSCHDMDDEHDQLRERMREQERENEQNREQLGGQDNDDGGDDESSEAPETPTE